MTGELAGIMAEIGDSGQRFGHREHIQLAFIAGRRHGAAAIADLMRAWIREIAAAHGAAHRYHETMTIAWAQLVAHHVAADPDVTDFDQLVRRYPALLDKTILARHYTTGVLGSTAEESVGRARSAAAPRGLLIGRRRRRFAPGPRQGGWSPVAGQSDHGPLPCPWRRIPVVWRPGW